MILKARPMTTNDWTFIDNIASATVWHTGSSNPEIWDDTDALGIQVVPFQTTALDKKDEVSAVIVDATMKGTGQKVRYVLPHGGFAYLMNDDGKTIERL